MTGRLAGKVALITGAARGIGAVTAARFAQEGAGIVLVDRDEVAGSGAAAALLASGGLCRFTRADVTDADQVQAAVDEGVRAFGKIDILINNAGIYPIQSWDEITLDDFDRVMAVNVRSVFLMSKAVVPLMRREGGGKIANLCSAVVFGGAKGFTHYTAAKAAVLGLTRSMALELGDDNICVNAIAPGLVLTDTVKGDRPLSDVDANANLRALKRRAYPEDLVGTLLYLASADSDFVTGQTIVIDGGRVLH